MARRFKSKGRSYKTHQNKLRAMKKFYRLTYKHSKENHKCNEEKGYKKPDSSYFFMKYPDEKSFLKAVKVKGAVEYKR